MAMTNIYPPTRMAGDSPFKRRDDTIKSHAQHTYVPKESKMEAIADVLQKVFPRRPDNSPVDEALPWGDDNHQRGRFFDRYAKEVWKPRHCPEDRAEAIRKETLIAEYKTDTLKGFNGDADELLKKLTARVEADYPLALVYLDEQSAKDGEAKNGQEAPRNDPPATPAQGTPSQTPSAPVSAQSEPVQSGMSEAGFSMNFFWVDGDGEEAQFTMRESTWQKGLDAVPQFKARLRAMGYMPKAEWLRKQGAGAQTASTQTSAPADSGKAACYLIKVGRTFKNDKDQILLECEGFEEPLKYSAKEAAAFVKVLSGLRKADGSALTAADLTQGAKIAVKGLVRWEKNEKDGKTYHNVMGTEAA